MATSDEHEEDSARALKLDYAAEDAHHSNCDVVGGAEASVAVAGGGASPRARPHVHGPRIRMESDDEEEDDGMGVGVRATRLDEDDVPEAVC